MSGFSSNRGRVHAVRCLWTTLALALIAGALLVFDLAGGRHFDPTIRSALIATLIVASIACVATRWALAAWFSRTFTDEQDPLRD